MKHLEYKDTNNKAHKTYYDKFKKMVKSDLDGDGWFLLVNDFPFKDGPNIMFTAGEDIGKWKDKNLVSLYGKTNYIIGRCRKKGPVISLLHFQEGDYIKQATESGLRKQLKEYFQGTGVSIRIFKSVKVSDPEPETETNDEYELAAAPTGELSTELDSVRNMDSIGQKRNAIMDLINKVLADAKTADITDDGAFNVHLNKLKRYVQGGKIDPALGEIQEIIGLIDAAGGGDSGDNLFEEFQTLIGNMPPIVDDFDIENLDEVEAHLDKILDTLA